MFSREAASVSCVEAAQISPNSESKGMNTAFCTFNQQGHRGVPS